MFLNLSLKVVSCGDPSDVELVSLSLDISVPDETFLLLRFETQLLLIIVLVVGLASFISEPQYHITIPYTKFGDVNDKRI